MRTLISVPIAMTPDLANWLTKEAKVAGSRSAYVRRLIERERDTALSDKVSALETRIKALEKQNP